MIPDSIVNQTLEYVRKGRANYEFFFNRLESPDWIAPLVERRFFSQPPEPIVEGGYVRFPAWPESSYLARVADRAPEEVASVLLAMPESTNPRVNEDIAAAAQHLPVESILKLVNRLCTAARSPYSLLLAEKVMLVAVKLASEGQVRPSLRLLNAILSLRVVETETTSSSYQNQVASSLESYEFERLLNIYTPVLTQHLGMNAFRFFAGLLNSYYSLATRGFDQEQVFTSIDRPAIEKHSQNWEHKTLDYLVNAVRDSASQLIASDPSQLTEVVQVLEHSSWSISKRIAIYLIASAETVDQNLLQSFMLNRSYFQDSEYRHEYALLSSRHFAKLPVDNQEEVLRWIDDQDENQISEMLAFMGAQPSTAAIKEAADYRRLERLATIRSALSGDWKVRFDKLLAEHGEPDHPDFTSYSSGVFVGPTSPVSEDDLKALSPREVVEYLKTWQPASDTVFGPTPEGLSRSLSEVVSGNAKSFSASAAMFVNLGPTYVRGFLSGVEAGLKKGETIDWDPVLDLCQWVIQRTDNPHTESRLIDSDPDWGWTRKQVASLIGKGLSSVSTAPPIGLRFKVWEIIQFLTNDSDPTPEYEAQYGGNNMDPATMSINTTRGEAMHALIHYLLWVKQNHDDISVPFTLEFVPEAAAVLEARLDVAVDSSLAVRSVYGQYAPWLAMVDEKWFTEHKTSIFPRATEEAAYWSAAWNTYIAFCQPYNRMLVVLCEEYELAIERLEGSSSNRTLRDVPESLGVHILIFFGRSLLEIGDGGLLDQFFSLAPPEVRAKALGSLGHDVWQNATELPKKFTDRFEKLWSYRIDECESRQGATCVELAKFGWWFAAGVFDEPWDLDTVDRILTNTESIEPPHLVFERLAVIAKRLPKRSFEVMKRLSESKISEWDLRSESVKSILREALLNDDADLKSAATDFVHLLGAKGFSEFRSLLM